ncbi:hypothetical protein TrCOL_g360 [Triparma columacea]|uniref:Bromo domain-containing protein n=1 Tax=Triparma columacea TaxID=722753 RepID=A0A9W7GEP9_9STRA|nr:hypothetical protein TrCOL_g360 [Triparma columacea]
MATEPASFDKLTKLIEQIIARPDSEAFRDPVPWEELGLIDYPQIVKQPMDLGTVLTYLKANKYATIHAAIDDVRLIWTNCQAYNSDGSDFYVLAAEFSKRFEEKVAKLLADSGLKPAATQVLPPSTVGLNDTEPTPTERQDFARFLFRIGKEELGKVVTVLDDKSPQALTKNAAEDEVEINVDFIVPRVFHELNHYVTNLVQGGNKMGNKFVADMKK